MENEIKRIPAILKEVPKSQIADMRKQVLFKNMVEFTEKIKRQRNETDRRCVCLF